MSELDLGSKPVPATCGSVAPLWTVCRSLLLVMYGPFLCAHDGSIPYIVKFRHIRIEKRNISDMDEEDFKDLKFDQEEMLRNVNVGMLRFCVVR